MTVNEEHAIEAARRELLITRVFDDSVDNVFDAWTDPQQVELWWGPRTFTSTMFVWEARPGGTIRLDMISPEGEVYPVYGYFHEVREPERMLFTSSAFQDENGQSQLEVVNTVIFLNYRKKTRITLQVVVIRSTPEIARSLETMKQSWRQSLDKLADLLNHQKASL